MGSVCGRVEVDPGSTRGRSVYDLGSTRGRSGAHVELLNCRPRSTQPRLRARHPCSPSPTLEERSLWRWSRTNPTEQRPTVQPSDAKPPGDVPHMNGTEEFHQAAEAPLNRVSPHHHITRDPGQFPLPVVDGAAIVASNAVPKPRVRAEAVHPHPRAEVCIRGWAASIRQRSGNRGWGPSAVASRPIERSIGAAAGAAGDPKRLPHSLNVHAAGGVHSAEEDDAGRRRRGAVVRRVLGRVRQHEAGALAPRAPARRVASRAPHAHRADRGRSRGGEHALRAERAADAAPVLRPRFAHAQSRERACAPAHPGALHAPPAHPRPMRGARRPCAHATPMHRPLARCSHAPPATPERATVPGRPRRHPNRLLAPTCAVF